jgi:sigma-B regulation protein RsbU (phosphoserine phosphatase)
MPGDVLILYSDGITEAEDPDGRLFGWQGLEDALLAVHAAPADIILQTLLQAVDIHRRDEAMRDDMAVLVVRRQPRSVQRRSHRSFVIPTRYGEVERIQTLLVDLLGPWAARPDCEIWLHETTLAVVEHVTNIIRHAYGEDTQGMIFGLLTITGDYLIMETVDRGEAIFDNLMLDKAEAMKHALDHAREGGYGLAVIRVVMDVLHYERLASGRNVWRLERRLPVVAVER